MIYIGGYSSPGVVKRRLPKFRGSERGSPEGRI